MGAHGVLRPELRRSLGHTHTGHTDGAHGVTASQDGPEQRNHGPEDSNAYTQGGALGRPPRGGNGREWETRALGPRGPLHPAGGGRGSRAPARVLGVPTVSCAVCPGFPERQDKSKWQGPHSPVRMLGAPVKAARRVA